MPAWLVLVSICGCSQAHDGGGKQEPTLTVLTYNVYADKTDYESMERIIRASGAELVMLQEVTLSCAATFESLKAEYPHQYWSNDAHSDGRVTALLSALPMNEVRHLPARYGWHDAWYAQVDSPVGVVQVLGVHLAPPLTADRRFTIGAMFDAAVVHQREIDAFCENVDFEAPLIILGDFNEDEFGDATMSLRRRGLKRAVALRDLLKPTWRYLELPLVARRLDHVFHSNTLAVVDSAVIRDGGSDHWPVFAKFRGASPSDPSGPGELDGSPNPPSNVTINATEIAGQSHENQ